MFCKDGFDHNAVVGGGKSIARGQLEGCSESPTSSGSQQRVERRAMLGLMECPNGKSRLGKAPDLLPLGWDLWQDSSPWVGVYPEQHR